MSQPTIRAATPADAPAIGLLVHRLLSTAVPSRLPSLEHLSDAAHTLLAEGKMLAWVAEADGQPVGTLTAKTSYAVYARGAFGEINELYVEPAFRGTGLAARLVDTVRAHGQSVGWSRLQLTAPEAGTPGAERAYAFYARLGFGDVGPTWMLPIG